MSLQKSRTRINVKGGCTFKMREISPSASNTFVDYGYLESLEFTDTRGIDEVKDACGNLINANTTDRTVQFVLTLMQTTKEEIDAVAALENKFMDCIYHVPLSLSGNYQHLSMPVVKFNPSIELIYNVGTSRRIKMTGYALAPKAAFVRTPVDYNVVVNVPYVFLDDTTAIQDPSDAAADVATNCL